MSSPLELTKAGRYQIVRELGRGAMGVVYQGFDPVIGRTVAIKTMLIEGFSAADYEEYKKRFRREAQAAGALSHPNIVTVHDFGEDNGVLYLAMEFLKGVSLEEVLRRQKVLAVEDVVRLFEQVSSALDHAHRHQVVHRDIKPANIMLLDNGQAKVTDFGIARLLSSATGMTRVGQIVGTPSYMSPEQVRGLPVDGRSDIFSLGVILYLALTGRKPFEGPSLTTVIYKIVNEDPVPVSQINKDLHPGLSAIVSRALVKDPNRRYQTCGELAEDLKNYKTLGQAATAISTPAPPGTAAGPDAVQPAPRVAKPASSAPLKIATKAEPPDQPKTAPPAPARVAANAADNRSLPGRQAAPAARRRSSIIVGSVIVAALAVAGMFGGRLLRQIRQTPQSTQGPVQSAPPSRGGSSTDWPPAAARLSDSTTKTTSPVSSQDSAGTLQSPGEASKTGQTTVALPQPEAQGPSRATPGNPPGNPASRASREKQAAAAGLEKPIAGGGKSQSAAPASSTQPPATGSQAPAQQPTGAPSSPAPALQAPQPSAPATSQLIVETDPTGYDVFVDDKGYGRSDQPVVANITPGKHVLSLKKDGTEVYRKSFTQTSDTHEVTIRPQPH